MGRLCFWSRKMSEWGKIPAIYNSLLQSFSALYFADNNERGYLRDTCLTGQDAMKSSLDYFGIRNNPNSN